MPESPFSIDARDNEPGADVAPHEYIGHLSVTMLVTTETTGILAEPPLPDDGRKAVLTALSSLLASADLPQIISHFATERVSATSFESSPDIGDFTAFEVATQALRDAGYAVTTPITE